MKGFKVVCKDCGKEIDFEDAYKNYACSSPKNKFPIALEINHNGAIEDIICECGNNVWLI